jgi:hypothetical protein
MRRSRQTEASPTAVSDLWVPQEGVPGNLLDPHSAIATVDNAGYEREPVGLGWLHMAEQRHRTDTVTAADIGSDIDSGAGFGAGIDDDVDY